MHHNTVLKMELQTIKGEVAHALNAEKEHSQFIVTPNCSMSWRGNKLFVTSLAVVSFGIASLFAFQGLWVILPFVGFEIAFLAVVLYWSCLRASQREVISIDDDNIRIEVGRRYAQKSHCLQSPWTSVRLYPAVHNGSRGRLVMRSKGKEIEVGACLSEEDRKSLAASIRQTLVRLTGKTFI